MSAVLLSAREIRSVMTWEYAIEALRDEYRRASPVTEDLLLRNRPHSLFMRGVALPHYGAGVKLASILPPNTQQPDPLPTKDAVFIVIDEDKNSHQLLPAR